MNNLTKILFAAGWLAVGSMAMNNVMADEMPCDGPMMHHDRMEHMHKRHLQRLHEALHLKPDQEKAWDKFADSHPDFRREQMERLPAPERLEHVIEGMEHHLKALKEFYAVLTPEQRHAFDDAVGHGYKSRHDEDERRPRDAQPH